MSNKKRLKRNSKLRKNVRLFACHHAVEIGLVEDIILKKIDKANIQRVVFYSGLNNDMFPSYRIALDKDDSINGSIFECYMYYGDETDFSDLNKKDIKTREIIFSVAFDDPGHTIDFDDIDSVIEYIDKKFKKKVVKKYRKRL